MPSVKVNPITGDISDIHSQIESFVSTFDPNNIVSINIVKNDINNLLTAIITWFDPT
jgi:hypothetical protein